MPVNSGIKILLVEDSAVLRKMEAKTLRSLGYDNIIEATHGDDAIKILHIENNINIIISDWNMPGKNGFELLKWVRKSEKFSHLPFLMATGRGEKKQITKAGNAGVSSFISKPFDAIELNDKIEGAFGFKAPADVKKDHQVLIADTGKIILRIGYIQVTDHLLLGVLKHLIDTGEYHPRYFELDTHCLGCWNPVAYALENGDLDAAFIMAPIAMDLYSYGVPLKLILFAHRNGSIFVRNKYGGSFSRPYRNFYDGKTFLIPHLLSIQNMLAHTFFTGIGLKPGFAGQDDVNVFFEVVSPIKMQEVLARHEKIGGFMVAEPLGARAISAGISEMQFMSGELWDNHPCCVVAVREKLTRDYPQVMHEFTQMLVSAGRFIERNPDIAAGIAKNFLDPHGMLGLTASLIKKAITDPKGIRTGDLYPCIDDLNRIQQYLYDQMGIGNIIDLEKFVDLRFADKACRDNKHSRPELPAQKIKTKKAFREIQSGNPINNIQGQYLLFSMGREEFGINILKVKEIIRMQTIRQIPHTPDYIMGITNLRGFVIPVIDLHRRFDITKKMVHDRTVIIVIQVTYMDRNSLMGITADSVLEVCDIRNEDIEENPVCDETGMNTDFILAMATINNKVKILLNIDKVLIDYETDVVEEQFDMAEV